MKKGAFSRDNHFVSRGYLKRWASPEKKICCYRTLVSHENVPFWKQRSTRGVAFHSYLYTKLVAGRESDEFEKWLEREFETPAEAALEKATSGGRLTPHDWTKLIRFLAAQDVRTPARLVEFIQRWSDKPDFLKETMAKSVARVGTAYEAEETLPAADRSCIEDFPLYVTTKAEPGADHETVMGEMVVGRSLWLWSMRHLLTNTAKILQEHRWTVLAPPNGLTWFTSDNPVVRLNFNSLSEYDFRGGWNRKGTDIFFPLSPHHLLYTQVGHRPPQRGEVMPLAQARMIRRFIAEHADRMIFAAEQDGEVPRLRPRIVNDDQVKHERAQWAKWHEDQTNADLSLMSRSDAI